MGQLTMSPYAALRPCSAPGCRELVSSGRCEQHRRERESNRGSASARGYGRKWQAYRLRYLAQHLWCVLCAERKVVRASTVVDHITPHKGDERLFWDPMNHRALCKPCHDRYGAK